MELFLVNSKSTQKTDLENVPNTIRLIVDLNNFLKNQFHETDPSQVMTPLAEIVSGFWIRNRKTVENWKRLCCCYRQKDEQKVYNLNSKMIWKILSTVSNDCYLRSTLYEYDKNEP